jgi:hypothetical protein
VRVSIGTAQQNSSFLDAMEKVAGRFEISSPSGAP